MISVDIELIPNSLLFKKQYNLKKLLKDLNNPQNKFEVINVVGTNGKGSTSNYIYKNLVENNKKVGLFFSPAFLFQNQRIQTNGNYISDEKLLKLIDDNKKYFSEYELTFFEIWTFLAIQFFVEEKIEIAVVEAGIGGILDSTNCFERQIAVCLTSIGFDHTEILGETIEEIIKNKVGIAKPGVKIYTSENNKKYDKIFKEVCKNQIIYCKNTEDFSFQKYNKSIARDILKLWGIEFNIKTSAPLGRITKLRENPNFIIDGCHNFEGAEELIQSISNLKDYCVLFASSKGKEQNPMIELLAKNCKEFYVTSFVHSKAWDIKKVSYKNKVECWKTFLEKNKEKNILVCGSLYFIPQIYEWFVGENYDLFDNKY